jgi:hypothetical protein
MALHENISTNIVPSMERELEWQPQDLDEGQDVFASREELESRPETVRKRIETETSGNRNSISINGVDTGYLASAEDRPINLSVFDPAPTGSPLLQQQDKHSVVIGHMTRKTSIDTLRLVFVRMRPRHRLTFDCISWQCSACDRTFTGKFSVRNLRRHFQTKHSGANLLQPALEDLDHGVKSSSSAQENSTKEAAKHKKGHQPQQASAQTLKFASTETEVVHNPSQYGSDREEKQKLSVSHGPLVHDELEDARRFLEGLTARDDISEDFWDSLGLTRSSIESTERLQGRFLLNSIIAGSVKSEKEQSFTASPPWSKVNIRNPLTSSKDIGTMPDPRPQTMSVTEKPHAASTSPVPHPPYHGVMSDSFSKLPGHMTPAHTPTRLSKLVERTKLPPVTPWTEEYEQDEFDKNKGVGQPITNQLPDPLPIYPPPRPERLTMELPKPPLAHEDVIVNGHPISDKETEFANGVLDAHSALRYQRADGTQRQRDLPSSEKLSTTNQPIHPGRDGEEPAQVTAQSEDVEVPRVDDTRPKSDDRVAEYYWTCCQCSTNRLPGNGQGCAECDHRICADCGIDDRNRSRKSKRRAYYDAHISSWRKNRSDITSKRSPDKKQHLLTWFNAHRDDPYPDATETVALAEAAQLTVNGVNNWFINARRRYRSREFRYMKDAARFHVPEQPGMTSTGSGTNSSDTATTDLKRHRPHMENDEVWPRWTIVGTTMEQQLETYLSEHGLPQDVFLCPMRVDEKVAKYYLLVHCEERSHSSVRQFFAQPSIVKLLEVGTNGQEVQIQTMRSGMPQKLEALIARQETSTELSTPDSCYSAIGRTSTKYEGEAYPIIETHRLEAVPNAVRDDGIRYEGYEEILQPPAQEARRTGKEQSSTGLRSSIYEFDSIDEQLRKISDCLELEGTYLGVQDTLVKLLRELRTALVELGRIELNTVSAENTRRIVVALAELRKELSEIHFHFVKQVSRRVFPNIRYTRLWRVTGGPGVDMHRLQYDLETTISAVNAFVQQSGSELFTISPWDWSIWKRKTAHPPAIVPYPTALSDDESDGASVASLVDSIFSEASLHSAATGLSVASGYSAAQIETATRELLHIFLEDQALVCLYAVAIERVDIGPARLRRNIGRLMKAFARDLRSEAEQELEILAARLVSAKRSYVAQAIIDRYEVRPSLQSVSHAQSPPRIHQREDSSDEEGEEADEEKTEEAVDEDLIEDLLAFRQFLAAGEAFANFRSKLEAFVLPKSTEVRTETIAEDLPSGQEATSSSGTGLSMRAPDGTAEQEVPPTVFAKIRKTTARLLAAVGLLEPPLDCGWVRLRWQCVSGQTVSTR